LQLSQRQVCIKLLNYLVTHFAHCKTGAVHFQTLTLSAVTSSIFDLFFDVGGEKASFEAEIGVKFAGQGG
jgi:hypothetical protein